MKPETLICNSSNITYNRGYIALWLENYALPETLNIDSISMLKKDHFHVSLLCVKNILENNPGSEKNILHHFCNFIKDNEVKFEGFTKEFRLAERNERKSIVALCKVSNLQRFTEYLTEKIDIEVAPQPTHVTIYTLQHNIGIGLNSPEEMEDKSRSIDMPNEIREVLL